jgi:hypothetical protein
MAQRMSTNLHNLPVDQILTVRENCKDRQKYRKFGLYLDVNDLHIKWSDFQKHILQRDFSSK